MAGSLTVVVRTDHAEPPAWEAAAGASSVAVLDRDTWDDARGAILDAGCVLIDGRAPDPVALARRVLAVNAALQAVIVAPEADHPRIRRALLFASGVGELWIVPPAEVGPALVTRASAVTGQRRAYRATQARLESGLAALEPRPTRRALISDAYLAALLGVLPDPVLSIDQRGRVVTWSTAAERTIGYSRAQAVGRPLPELLASASPEVLDRIAGSADAELRTEIRFRTRDGEPRTAEITVVPVESGSLRMRAVVLHDVTEERRAQAEREAQAAEVEMQAEELQSQALQLEEAQAELESANDELRQSNAALAHQTREAERARARAEEREGEQAFLAEAARVLAASLDYHETLRSVARLAVPRLADWCGVDMLEEGSIERLATVHPDPAKEELAREVARRWPLDPGSPVGVPAVLRTGKPEVIPEISEELLRAASVDEEQFEIVREVGLRSAMIVPMIARGRILGAITFVAAESGRRYHDEADLAFAEQLASRAAVAVDNARLLRETRLAREEAEHAQIVAEGARREADAANRAKSDFLATMSHEIRTPINAIVGYTDLLGLGIAGPITPEQRAQLDRIRSSSRHLLTLIEDVLDLAKVEAGRMEVARERVRAAEAVAAAIALIGPQAADSGVALENDADDDRSTSFVGDDDRVRQILVNLLSNAVKFTESGGSVRVTCGTSTEVEPGAHLAAEGPWSYIRVEDTGIGIAPEELETVFRPFVQAEGGLTRTRGGTGLGLSISRQLARLMGGDLTVTSQRGVGSAFTLWLPSEDATLPPLDATLLERVRRDAAPAGVAEVGDALRAEADAILNSYVERLRADPRLPLAGPLARGNLEDHAASFLADVAQALIVLDESDYDVADLLRDGTEIQRVIADLHGAQRARLGWTESAVRREFDILREEITTAVRRRSPRTEIAEALEVLMRFVDHAERVSAQAVRRVLALHD